MTFDTPTREATIDALAGVFLPNAAPSRTSHLLRTLNSFTGEQLAAVTTALNVALKERRLSFIRDAVESKDLRTIEAVAKFSALVDLSVLDGELNRMFAVSDLMYDVYTPEYDAHVEAFATYHLHCNGVCLPYDRDIEYSEEDMAEAGIAMPAKSGHYISYVQDYELMEIVEKYPERVSTLVKFAAERKGISPELLPELVSPQVNALKEGLL